MSDPLDAMLAAIDMEFDEDPTADEKHNVIVAAGALHGALAETSIMCDPVVDWRGQVTGELILRFNFMGSPYKVTLERVKD